jgi:hypothetical protein
MSNPLNGLVSTAELEKAKVLVMEYREASEPPGTKDDQVGWWGEHLSEQTQGGPLRQINDYN